MATDQGQEPQGDAQLWKGTIWGSCCCLTPLCCRGTTVIVTERRIDMTHGCCGRVEDTLDFRRITDVKYKGSILCCCCNRGTVTIYAADASTPELNFTLNNAKVLYEIIRDNWSKVGNKVIVAAGGKK